MILNYILDGCPWFLAGLVEVNYFLEVICWQVTSFQMIAGLSLNFCKIHMKYIAFMGRTIKILISNWLRTRKFSQLLQAGKTIAFDFAHHGHALVTLYFQFFCSDWSKFDRWVHVENLCSILNLVYFESWSWQSFVSILDVTKTGNGEPGAGSGERGTEDWERVVCGNLHKNPMWPMIDDREPSKQT